MVIQELLSSAPAVHQDGTFSPENLPFVPSKEQVNNLSLGAMEETLAMEEKEPLQLTWSCRGIFNTTAELLKPDGEVLASYKSNGFFTLRISAEWQGHSFHFKHDGKMHDNHIILDRDFNRIAKYEESLGVVEGTLFDEVEKCNYDFRRTNHFKYHYELKRGSHLIAEIDKIKMRFGFQSGTMTIHETPTDKNIMALCTSLRLVVLG